MNDRLIPVVILLLNFVLPLIAFQFLPEIPTLLLLAVWSFVSSFCLVSVAYWVYEDGKRLGFMEARLWHRVNALEDHLKISQRNEEELEERIAKLEAKKG